jgi:uncharacterized protein (DUF305 family)
MTMTLASVTLAVALLSPADTAKVRHTQADVDFMQGMIAHHGQALEMAALVPSRSQSTPLRMLAERITVSQKDEIGLIRRWLADNGEAAPAEGHQHGGHLMPGMLTADQMAALAKATGPAFEKLFLEGMIQHHEGAITMVATLFGTPGAGQETDIFRFATDVDADQRAEIRRMRALLKAADSKP